MTLQSEDMGKLVAGKSVLRYSTPSFSGMGVFTNRFGQPETMVRIELLDRPKYVCGGDPADFTLIGTLTPDGWIEGEWAENPVGDMEVQWRNHCGISSTTKGVNLVWFHGPGDSFNVCAFRPAHREAQPETDGGGEGAERLSKVINGALRAEVYPGDPIDQTAAMYADIGRVLGALASKGV